MEPLESTLSRVDLKRNGSLRRVRALIEERANEYSEITVVMSYAKQPAASALLKKKILFINLIGKGLTQEIHGDGGSI